MCRLPERWRRDLAAWLCALLLLAPLARGEDEMMGFILDRTISHIGHDFYRYFSERLRDTSPLDFNLAVHERPSARWGSLVWVEYNQRQLFRSFLAPNTAELRDIAYQAADLVLEEILRSRIEEQLQDNTDLERDEL